MLDMKSVITASGLGNQKDGEKFGSFQGTRPVVFVVVNGVDWYVREPESWENGLEDSRRCFREGIQAAIDMDEMNYYEPLEEYDFLETMETWSSQSHNEPPFDFFRRSASNPSMVYTDLYGGLDDKPVVQYTRVGKKVGRNYPCPCGSGEKFKKCCGK